jgi:hypothetical protein
MKVPVDGGTPIELARGQVLPIDIEVDSTSVYWATAYSDGGAGTIMKVGLAGGKPVTLASDQPTPTAIAIDSTHVYWVSSMQSIPLMKVPLEGGTPTPLGTVGIGVSIAVDATSVYFTETYRVGTLPLAGGTPVYLWEPLPPPNLTITYTDNIVVNSTGVYWTYRRTVDDSFVGGGVARLVRGSETQELVNVPAQGIAVDLENVYYGSYTEQTVVKVPLDGGSPLTLATYQNNPARMVVDATHLYWTTGSWYNPITEGGVAKARIR